MGKPFNSELLWAKIHLAEDRLFAATQVFWTHPRLGVLLPHFLVQAHYLMRGGLVLMEVARSRALGRPPEDIVARQLAGYLEVHIEEESGHDVWLLDDVCTLGLSRSDVLNAPPAQALVELLGAQYFWTMHEHPVAVLGYLILMEGYPPLLGQLEAIQLETGAPSTAFRCLKAHAEDDPAHLADLHRTLDGMDLSAAQTRAVAMCAFAAIEGLAALFEELLDRYAPSALGTFDGTYSPRDLRSTHA